MSDNEPLNTTQSNGGSVFISSTPLTTVTKNGQVKNDCDNDTDKTTVKLPTVDGKHQQQQQDDFIPPDGGLRAWTVMISAFLCNGVIFGVINTYSVLHSYLQDQLAEQHDTEASSKAALVGSLTIGTTFLLSPVAGMLTDKIGLRRTTFLGGLLSAGGLFLSSLFTHNIEALYLTYGIMFGFGAALAYTPTLAILGHYFKRYLGKVSGFVTAGSSVFTIILPPALDYLVKGHGLQTTLQVMALIACFIIICSFVYKPQHPPTPPPKRKEGRSGCNMLIRSIINVDIWKRKRYVIWALCVPLALFGYFVPYVHMVKFVQNAFPGNSENLPVMCIGISSGIGRLLFGFISDLPSVNRILLQQMALVFIGILTMLLPATNSYVLLIVFTLVMGLFDGCFISLLGPISYEICGPQGAAQAIGFLLGLSSLPLTVGPPIAGKIFDTTGSYTLPFVLAGIPPIVGACMIFLTRCVKDEIGIEDIEKNNIANNIKKSWEEGTGPVIPLMNGSSNHALENGKIMKKSENFQPATLATSGISEKYGLLNSQAIMSSAVIDCDIPSSSSSSFSSLENYNFYNNKFGFKNRPNRTRRYKYSVL